MAVGMLLTRTLGLAARAHALPPPAPATATAPLSVHDAGRGKGGEKAMDDYGLTVEVHQEPGHVLVMVAGEVDIATVPQLRERLAAPAASGRPLIVDLDRVIFIDAAGLGALANAARRAAAEACQNLEAARDIRVNGHRQHPRARGAGLSNRMTGTGGSG